MGHNWWSVCVSGAGVGVIALLGEDPRATGWLKGVETALAGFFDYRGMVLLNKTTNFDPSGAFFESVHYAGCALESHLTFCLARTHAISPPPHKIPVQLAAVHVARSRCFRRAEISRSLSKCLLLIFRSQSR
jgi:hypothetical protein